MSQWIGLTAVAAVVAVMGLGCGQQPGATAAVVEDKTYTVTPTSVRVKAGSQPARGLPLGSAPIQTETFDRAFIP